jgi:RNA polymerase sigma-70 factor, ECF subfamily
VLGGSADEVVGAPIHFKLIIPPMRDEVADEHLMELYRDGDAGAFDVLYHRHKGGLFRYLLRQCKHKSVAEELFQDVWSNIIRSRERYQPTAKFSTFLYQVAHNRLIDHIRQRPEIALSLDVEDENADSMVERIPADPAGQPEILIERKRLIESMVEHIEALPILQREAFLLREEAGLSLDEIALATGVSPETAKSRLRYAVAKLRDGLRGLL